MYMVYNIYPWVDKGKINVIYFRRQTRITALDLIAFLAAEENPKQWLHMADSDMDSICSTIKDQNLRLTLAFGIGIHHAGNQKRINGLNCLIPFVLNFVLLLNHFIIIIPYLKSIYIILHRSRVCVCVSCLCLCLCVCVCVCVCVLCVCVCVCVYVCVCVKKEKRLSNNIRGRLICIRGRVHDTLNL